MTNTNTISLELSRKEFELVRLAIRNHIDALGDRFDKACELNLPEQYKDSILAKVSDDFNFANAFECELEDIARGLNY